MVFKKSLLPNLICCFRVGRISLEGFQGSPFTEDVQKIISHSGILGGEHWNISNTTKVSVSEKNAFHLFYKSMDLFYKRE